MHAHLFCYLEEIPLSIDRNVLKIALPAKLINRVATTEKYVSSPTLQKHWKGSSMNLLGPRGHWVTLGAFFVVGLCFFGWKG